MGCKFGKFEVKNLNISDEETSMTSQQRINSDFDDSERFAKGLAFAVGVLFLAILGLWCATAHAQTAPTFDCAKKTGESPLSTACTWDYPGATTCTASGASAWTGTVPCTGTRNFSGVTVKLTLLLNAVGPATAGKMRLTWTPPTQNTDGSALTNLGGYILSYGTAAGSLTQTINLAVPGANTFDITGLTAGTWFASMQAGTTSCFPTTLVDCHVSLSSNVTSKAVTTTPGGNLPPLSVVLDPYTVPKPPTAVTAIDPTAFEIRPSSTGTLVATRIGLVPLGTRCYEEQRIAAYNGVSAAYNGVPVELVDKINWPLASVLREAWAKCGA